MFRRYLPAVTALSLLISLAILTSALFAAQEKSVKWRTDFEKAAKDAKKANKPIMIDFYTDWCGWCKKLDKDVYTDSRVVDLSKKFVCVKIDGDENRKLVEKYDLQGYPTIVFLNSKSEEVERIVGYKNADDFLKTMRKALDKNK